MSFSITESDVWPRVARAIRENRAECMEGLLRCADLDAIRRMQARVETLDWVMDEAKPKKPPQED